MYHVTKREFDRLCREHPDYVCRCFEDHEHNGIVCKRGEYCCFEYLLSKNPDHGTKLIFQHIHFEID